MPADINDQDLALAQRLMWEQAQCHALDVVRHACQGETIKIIMPDYTTQRALAAILAEQRELREYHARRAAATPAQAAELDRVEGEQLASAVATGEPS